MPQKALARVGRVLGLLLLRELDASTLTQLQPFSMALKDIDLELPEVEQLDALAVEYFEYFINPQRGFPLVQSLYEQGSYESAATAGIRKISTSLGLELDSELARGAPPDHLGAELLLWAEIQEVDPVAAKEFSERHLGWALSILPKLEAQGFYGQLGEACREFIEILLETPEA